jgi:predicted RNase H-like nuclease (RuvC/YqgF family)
MKNDAISNEFIHQRLKEIVDETIVNEKEELLKKYNEELAELRAKVIVKEQVVNELKMKNNSIKEECEGKVNQLQQIMNNDFQNYKLQENTVKNLQMEMENLHKNYDNEIKKITEENLNKTSKLTNELTKLKNDYNNMIDNFQVISINGRNAKTSSK